MLDDGLPAEARALAGLSRPLQRADENELECLFGEHGPHLLGETAPVVCQREVCHARMLPAQTPCGLPMPYRKEIHDLSLPAQTLSASVERTPGDAACPQVQPVISGISSPYRAM